MRLTLACSELANKTSVPPAETVRVKCQVNFGPLEEDLPVVFEPKEKGAWPVGQEFKGCLH